MADVIERLRSFRQSSVGAVVNAATLSSTNMVEIEHPIEPWIVELVIEEATRRDRRLSLIVISGNAGDGKSYLLRSIRRKLAAESLDLSTIRWVLDATHADGREQQSRERLLQFFSAFTDSADWSSSPLHIAAINTGAAVDFLGYAVEHAALGFSDLDRIVNAQLGIRPLGDSPSAVTTARFDRVLVIDLDRRALVSLFPRQNQFFDRLLDTVSLDGPSGWLQKNGATCHECPQAQRCPVHTNLQLLKVEGVRTQLKEMLLDIALEDRVHLGPRGLWHLVYKLTVGGLDDICIRKGEPLATCSDIAGMDPDDLSRSLFFSALFHTASTAAPRDPIALTGELARLDPALRFTLRNSEVSLLSALSAREDLENARPLAQRVGVPPESLVGPSDDHERGHFAVRREFFLGQQPPDPVRTKWLSDWCLLVEDCRGAALAQRPLPTSKLFPLLQSALRQVFRHPQLPRPDFWQLKLPWRGRKDLFTHVRLRPVGRGPALDEVSVLGPDGWRVAGQREFVQDLSQHLGTYPTAIPVCIEEGPSLKVTWPLYRMLKGITEFEYVSGSLDPERLQHLDRIGASIAAQVAKDEGVVITDGSRVIQIYGEDGDYNACEV